MNANSRPVAKLDPLDGSTRTERVARAIRAAIATGDMAPGDRLLEADLAAQLGTSNGPVREALRQLQAEGLVTRVPYRGAFVSEVSEEEIEQVLIPVRLIIERYAFKRASATLTEEDIDELNAIVDRMHRAARSRDDDDLAEQDFAFHELVIRRAAPDHCLLLWRVIQPRVRSYFHRDIPIHSDRAGLVGLHEELLEAVKSGDSATISTAVDAHIRHRLDVPADGRPRSS